MIGASGCSCNDVQVRHVAASDGLRATGTPDSERVAVTPTQRCACGEGVDSTGRCWAGHEVGR